MRTHANPAPSEAKVTTSKATRLTCSLVVLTLGSSSVGGQQVGKYTEVWVKQ